MVAIPAARPASISRKSSPTYQHFAAVTPIWRAASSSGAGCGLACAVVSPEITHIAADNASCGTSASVKRAALLVTIPQGICFCLNDASKPIKGSRICILGAAYKKDVDDPRESPSFELMKLLIKRGAVLTYTDPHVPSLPKMRHYPDLPAMDSQELTPAFLASQDCVLISTDHSAYDHDFIVQHSRFVLDTRNATKNVSQGREKIRKA